MSTSWTYLTRRFILQNYRDYVCATIVCSYALGVTLQYLAHADDDQWSRQRVYTHDESDIRYKETSNRTDGAVKREHAIRYAEKIKLMRAQKEREAALDAFNYLNNKNLT